MGKDFFHYHDLTLVGKINVRTESVVQSPSKVFTNQSSVPRTRVCGCHATLQESGVIGPDSSQVVYVKMNGSRSVPVFYN